MFNFISRLIYLIYRKEAFVRCTENKKDVALQFKINKACKLTHVTQAGQTEGKTAVIYASGLLDNIL